MKSLRTIGVAPMSLALPADDILEFHLARILLLLRHCGTSSRIDGLTKMAKLDFFVRYPDFFQIAREANGKAVLVDVGNEQRDSPIESAMVRHHYGPWDKRYYQILSHLESKDLITVNKDKTSFRLALTDQGKSHADRLTELPSFSDLVLRMKEVKKVFGARSGDSLKRMIYKLFDAEVGKRKMGGVIRR